MLLIFIAAFWSVFTSVPEFKDMSDQFYLGVENPIFIRLNQCEAEDIQIKVSEGSLHKRSDSTYIYVGQQPLEELKIKLYYKKILCAVKVVSVTNIPAPAVAFSNESGGMIRIADLNSSVTLGFKYDANYPDQLKSDIVSFQVSIQNKSGMQLYFAPIKGNKLDDLAITKLKQAGVGSIINISNIFTQSQRSALARTSINHQVVVGQ
ncbi:MAG: hypothetical protein KAX53_06450 [Saprospiraceae bacterium]|nr:hypothetical protein [Saprospiraceae bacterium]